MWVAVVPSRGWLVGQALQRFPCARGPTGQLGAAGLGDEAFVFSPEPGNLGGFISQSLEPLIFLK